MDSSYSRRRRPRRRRPKPGTLALFILGPEPPTRQRKIADFPKGVTALDFDESAEIHANTLCFTQNPLQ
jgi:hypothetical protein